MASKTCGRVLFLGLVLIIVVIQGDAARPRQFGNGKVEVVVAKKQEANTNLGEMKNLPPFPFPFPFPSPPYMPFAPPLPLPQFPPFPFPTPSLPPLPPFRFPPFPDFLSATPPPP
ncbi:vegetative cell wall protein gp1-like [Durio zibethinus]|uniref:Vegetative cell wall protein gp1-like n=1 Tax=Durio zibethinus TaxID=66656 RepID=A0A6P5WF56_DURZI|nr:vegetative cell wall protein gp1-like [Durio zibethinus]